ncbi:hypothetical protein VTP01DRAFT_476 [Rhizomucor pusillus]|uniref:uncharacterized protein n=1 Tax=Rhizomucor pusillus TaxID=4840 RepID=UPI0037449ED3
MIGSKIQFFVNTMPVNWDFDTYLFNTHRGRQEAFDESAKKASQSVSVGISRVLSACSKDSSMRTYVGMLKSKYQMGDKQLKENYITKAKERNQSITNNNFNVSNMVVGPMINTSITSSTTDNGSDERTDSARNKEDEDRNEECPEEETYSTEDDKPRKKIKFYYTVFGGDTDEGVPDGADWIVDGTNLAQKLLEHRKQSKEINDKETKTLSDDLVLFLNYIFLFTEDHKRSCLYNMEKTRYKSIYHRLDRLQLYELPTTEAILWSSSMASMIENGYVKNEQGALVQVDGMSEESKRRKHKAVCLN